MELKITNISIITATWNCRSTIVDCLQSIAMQTYLHREHIVVDGCSEDGTLDILEDYRSHFKAFLVEPDEGVYDALNKGIRLSTGDVIGFLHADDVYAHKDVLKHVAAAFEDPEVCAIYGNLQYVKKDNLFQVIRKWDSCDFSKQLLERGWMPPHPTLFIRRQWYQRIGGFDTRYHISADYLSILQLFMMPNFRVVHLPEVLVKMRVGGISNRSIKSLFKKSLEDWRALRQTGWSIIDAAIALGWKNISKISQFLN